MTSFLVGHAYHYTSASSFLSIVREGIIRASSTHALNDAEELSWGESCFERYAHSRDDEPVASVSRILDDEDVEYESNKINDIFVLSATTLDDDAAQWHSYADSGRGYAIGFRRYTPLAIRTNRAPRKDDEILTFSDSDFAGLETWTPVKYGDEQARSSFERLVDRAQTLLEKYTQKHRKLLSDADADDDSRESAELQSHWEKKLTHLEIAGEANAIFRTLKHEGWQSEKEIRSVAIVRGSRSPVRYRPANGGGITSYIELVAQAEDDQSIGRYVPDNRTPGPLPIAEVIVGPKAGPHDEAFVKELLQAYRYTDVNVRRSTVAMR